MSVSGCVEAKRIEVGDDGQAAVGIWQDGSGQQDSAENHRSFTALDLDHDGVLSSSVAHASPRSGADWGVWTGVMAMGLR
jgi:hypothetical protein